MKGRRVASSGVEVAAHGKVNLILRVLDRRPDGYHNLWSVMQAFDLADTIVAESARDASPSNTDRAPSS